MEVYVLTSIFRNYDDASADVIVELFDDEEKAQARKDEWFKMDKKQPKAVIEDYDEYGYRIVGKNYEYITEVKISKQKVK